MRRLSLMGAAEAQTITSAGKEEETSLHRINPRMSVGDHPTNQLKTRAALTPTNQERSRALHHQASTTPAARMAAERDLERFFFWQSS